ncbi:3-hydroxy-3-methylglutaryl-coenzyme A reductase-like isoform X2 [Tachypleus tridentatus]
MLSQAFYNHGHFCASHPWEVIVTFLTLTACMLSMGPKLVDPSSTCGWNYQCHHNEGGNKGMDIVVMTITRCTAVLYVYHQFHKLYKLGSRYLLGVAALFTIFSSFVFSTSVVNFLEGNFSELNEALPFFLILIDLSKTGLLAQFALSSSTQEDVRENIARGMRILGPKITLDTIVETLVIGVGTLSGVKRLEEMCCFACLSAVVNYIVFMTFFPACLSLVLELSREQEEGRPVWQLGHLTKVLQQEEEQKPNPVLQRVKVIMSAGLVLVHVQSRWPVVENESVFDHHEGRTVGTERIYSSDSNSEFDPFLQRWLAVSPEQLVMLVLAFALIVKYIFFENREELREQLAAVAASSRFNDSFNGNAGHCVTDCSMTKEGFQSNVFHSSSVVPVSSLADLKKRISFVVGEDENWEMGKKEYTEKEIQTEESLFSGESNISSLQNQEPRTLEECTQLLNSEEGVGQLTDEEVLMLVENKVIATYKLESVLNNPERGVHIRRKFIAKSSNYYEALEGLPYTNYDYHLVMGACCENVIGYVPIPVGVAGPLLLDNKTYYVPMATTEGCLVASTNRGCRALSLSGGVHSSIVASGMTRGPVVRLPSAQEAGEVVRWLKKEENYHILKTAFDSTSRFARLQRISTRIAGRYLFIRFKAATGDAMGMNMVSKGTEVSLYKLQKIFPNIEVISLSGNYCTDKKPSAVNWIEGRGKSVVCEAEIPAKVVKNVLKTSVQTLIDVNISKNLIGSAIAGSIGGFNAQAANIVTAIFIATGQDPAQNVESSNCITLMEPSGENGENLHISCTMPSIEIGTIGGGTVLSPQAACLDLLGVRGASVADPGQNAATLASVVCGTVLAGELSLLSALAAGHLVRSHMRHNRSKLNINSAPDP